MFFLTSMYSVKNVVERVGDAEHECGAVRFLMSSIRAPGELLRRVAYERLVFSGRKKAPDDAGCLEEGKELEFLI